ncbi:hypothetical protein BI355_1854 [Companilactobacillus crustorum]|nr:hypothetical protein BI355_1854 [Companilactobacillus crustorum]
MNPPTIDKLETMIQFFFDLTSFFLTMTLEFFLSCSNLIIIPLSSHIQ